MKKNIIIILVLFTLGFSLSEKRMVEITFNNITQLQQLVEMSIDLDHHRTLTEVHAFVTDKEFQLISQMNFGIREIPNEAKLYFETLKQNTMGSRDPMEDLDTSPEAKGHRVVVFPEEPNIWIDTLPFDEVKRQFLAGDEGIRKRVEDTIEAAEKWARPTTARSSSTRISSGDHASEAKISTLVDSYQCSFGNGLFALVVAPLGRNLL